jgi:hypothetical protein
MARAKRHYIPGYIWHTTHRYHMREFLLKGYQVQEGPVSYNALFAIKKRHIAPKNTYFLNINAK